MFVRGVEKKFPVFHLKAIPLLDNSPFSQEQDLTRIGQGPDDRGPFLERIDILLFHPAEPLLEKRLNVSFFLEYPLFSD